ncbi:MAG: hypothetical protein JF597_00715, partial [Streptomyces sp.]|nr:hypothetical protein [Streptomyces sp.]
VVVARSATITVVNVTQWVAMQLETAEDGLGNVTWTLLWHQVGDTSFWFSTGSYVGTADRIAQFKVVNPMADAAYGHIWLGDNDLPFVADSFSAASAGYAGETAAARVERLCDEQDVAVLVEPASSSEALDVQRSEPFVTLLRAVEDADLGVLHEVAAGIGYRPRLARYNAAVQIALDAAQGHLAEAPEPTDDDQRVRNDVTCRRTSGGQARATDDASIAALGSYEDSLTISVATDDRLDDHATWRVYAGTRPDLRWPRIDLDFGRQPGLIDDWLAVRLGARLTVANMPSQLLGEDVDVIVEGYSAVLRTDSWRMTLNCSPAAIWQVGTLGTTAVDHDAATLASSATSGATTLSVATVGSLWDTSGADFPIVIDGEQMLCTAVSGSSSPQTFTVTRATNGVVKAHSAGAQVHAYRPLLAAL